MTIPLPDVLAARIDALAGLPAWQRTLVFFAVWMLLWLPLVLPLARILAWQPQQPLTPQQKIALVVSLYAVVWPLLGATTRLPGASWSAYGLAGDRAFFAGGLVGWGLALLSLAIVFGAESAAGWVTWRAAQGRRLLALALPIFLLALGISWTEEAIFRGVLLAWFAADLGWLAALLITSAIFALSHLLWEQQDTLPQLPGLLLMGAVLVGARAAAGGSLGVAWGLHAGWIWGLTCLDSAKLMAYSDRAAPWLTGLGGKPLASLAGLLCLLLAAAALWLLAKTGLPGM